MIGFFLFFLTKDFVNNPIEGVEDSIEDGFGLAGRDKTG
jgi:hypothetical protein